jgi:beta-lactamase class A
MMISFTRRGALAAGLAVTACGPGVELGARGPEVVTADDPRFAAIEGRIGGRVGIAAFDTGSGAWLTHRAHERFAMCSTFKWVLAAQMLQLEQQTRGFLAREVRFSEADLLDYAPVARQHVARGWMTIEEMSAAVVVTSDNSCANLLLAAASGPEGLTRFLRAHGDAVTRLDRIEPAMNIVPPGDERDTTTPEAMARTMQRVLLTDEVLNAASRDKLIGWMIASTTGLQRLRGGLPSAWRAGDKTGTWNGEPNATNDVAIAWPPGRAPIIITCYFAASTAEPPARNAAHAEIARIVSAQWS